MHFRWLYVCANEGKIYNGKVKMKRGKAKKNCYIFIYSFFGLSMYQLFVFHFSLPQSFVSVFFRLLNEHCCVCADAVRLCMYFSSSLNSFSSAMLLLLSSSLRCIVVAICCIFFNIKFFPGFIHILSTKYDNAINNVFLTLKWRCFVFKKQP